MKKVANFMSKYIYVHMYIGLVAVSCLVLQDFCSVNIIPRDIYNNVFFIIIFLSLNGLFLPAFIWFIITKGDSPS